MRAVFATMQMLEIPQPSTYCTTSATGVERRHTRRVRRLSSAKVNIISTSREALRSRSSGQQQTYSTELIGPHAGEYV